MKLRYVTIAVLAACCIAALKLGGRQGAEQINAAAYTVNPNLNKITGSPVFASIRYNGVMYADEAMTEPADYLKTGDRAEILRDRSREIYYIKHNGRMGWTQADILDIPPDPFTVTQRLTAQEIEAYVHDMQFESVTDYFVWVDIARQRTYVLKYDDGGRLRLERDILCATGKNTSPTTRGFFTVEQRGESFYNARLKSGARYWVRFNGSYLFHSIALNEDGSVKDDTLGKRCSDGCVRMSMEDIKWFYDTIPEGTAVNIY